MRDKLILFSFLILLSSFLEAQSYIIDVKYYGIEEGLSHRNVYFSLKDQRGLMWFGTDYGLNRFDGYKFTWITKEKHGLQSNVTPSALLDKDGLLWLFYGDARIYPSYTLNLSGIDIFNPVTNEVQTYDAFAKGKTAPKAADILGVSKKENGDLVFMTKQNELFIYTGKGRFSKIPLKNNYTLVRNFHWSENGYFWFNAEREKDSDNARYVFAVNEKGAEVSAFQLESRYHLTFFYNEKNNPNEKWINYFPSTTNEEYTYREVNIKGQLIPNEEEIVFSNLEPKFTLFSPSIRYVGNSAIACFSSKSGFYIFEKEGGILHDLQKDHEFINWTNTITLDNTDKIWVCTHFGIYLITLRKNQFTKMLMGEDILQPTRALRTNSDGQLWAILEGESNLWNVQLSADNKKILNVETANNSQNPNRLDFGNNQFYSLEISEEGHLYYPNGHFLVTQVNLENFESQNLQSLKVPKFGTYAWVYFIDSLDRLWAGYDNGRIALFGKEESQWFWLSDDKNMHFITYQFIEEEAGFWVVTEAGLFFFDKNTLESKARYWSEGIGKYQLPFDNLRHAYLEEDGSTFWLGTGGQGLIRFDIETGDYQQFTQADGLTNNVIYAVYPDDFGNLWLSSDYGIMRFNKTTHQVNSYLTQDGISHNEFNRVSHHQTEDGTLFLGSLNGITGFHPKDFQADSTSLNAPLVINQFQQFIGDENKLVDKTPHLLNSQTIRLAPNDPFVRLEFGLLTFEDVDKVQYAYKIEGQDRNWNYQKENYIRLSRLPYGNYLLKIKGQASNGQWSSNELAINIMTLKPFYLETWFLILAVLLVFGSGFLFYKLRTTQLKKQKAALEKEVKRRTKTISEQAEQLKSLEKLKSRFFANVSHELRTPLTLMLGPINKLEKGDLPKEKANRLITFLKNNSTHLLKLVNEILDLSKLETNRLEIKEKEINFYNFLQPLLAQYKSVSSSEALQLRFDYRTDKSLNILLDIEKFEKIVHNFLSNAIKFTPEKGTVTLTVEDKKEQLLVKVSDTGTGIHPNDLPHIFDRFYQSKQPDAPVQGGTGIGLSLCKELADLLGGRVWAESEIGSGSVFYFEFPKKVAGYGLLVAGLDSDSDSSILQRENTPAIKEQKQEPSSEPKPATSNKQQATILIVEDNPELREYLEVLLSDDYNILTAENGKVALDLLDLQLATHNPQLIISDLMMPVMDGFQFLEKVKAHNNFRHIPVIMLTARADIRVKLHALRIGIDDYLTKPFVEEELKIRIENLLRNATERASAFSAENLQNETPEKPLIAEVDMKWLERVENLYLDYLDDSRLNLEFAAEKLFLSSRQLNRKLKQLTGLSPNQYLREIKLTKARDYIEVGKYTTIKETCYAVGFSDVKYFTKIYRERFGMSPSKSFS